MVFRILRILSVHDSGWEAFRFGFSVSPKDFLSVLLETLAWLLKNIMNADKAISGEKQRLRVKKILS